MHSTNRREFLALGTALAACCLFRDAVMADEQALPESFDMIAYCCLDCAECQAYEATIKNDDSIRADVAKRWKMKPEQINCLGCKSDNALFNCSLKKCAVRRNVTTCAHCPDFPNCDNEQWSKSPKQRQVVEEMRTKLESAKSL